VRRVLLATRYPQQTGTEIVGGVAVSLGRRLGVANRTKPTMSRLRWESNSTRRSSDSPLAAIEPKRADEPRRHPKLSCRVRQGHSRFVTNAEDYR